MAFAAVNAFFVLANLLGAGTLWLLGSLARAAGIAHLPYVAAFISLACGAVAVAFLHTVVMVSRRLSISRARVQAQARRAATTSLGHIHAASAA